MYVKTIRGDWVIFDIKHRGMVSANYNPEENIRGWSASLQRAMVFPSRSDSECFARDNDITDYVVLSTNDYDMPTQEKEADLKLGISKPEVLDDYLQTC